MTTTVKTFAPGYERVENGWIKFPSDVKLRKSLFNQEVFDHPAKANLYLLQSIVEYVSEEGETILEPFGGTGSILIATQMGRKVVMVELEPYFQELIKDGIDRFQAGETAKVVGGDCRLVLPLFCHHAIFSPPYGNVLSQTGLKKGRNFKSGEEGSLQKQFGAYSGSSANGLNIGRLSDFYYVNAMEEVYKRLFMSIPTGGTMTVLTKDHMGADKKRVMLGADCIRMAGKAGFRLKDWFKWKAPGAVTQKIAIAKGAEAVLDEDIIIFSK